MQNSGFVLFYLLLVFYYTFYCDLYLYLFKKPFSITKQQYVSIFFTRLWSEGTALNPEISGPLTVNAYECKTKQQAKMGEDRKY